MQDSQCKTDPDDIQIIYDGACPLCNAYVRHTDFKSAQPITFIDARQCPELVTELYQQGIDIDQGLVVNSRGARHHGADAMHVLSILTARRGLWNRFIAGLFASSRSSRLLYPVFRAGRNLLLRLLARPSLMVHDEPEPSLIKKMLYSAPIALLLLMLVNHVYLRYDANLSPWLGAGFGMFSTTDSVSARQLLIYGLDDNGFGRELPVPDRLVEEAKRASALPSTTMLTRFADMMHAHLMQEDCYAIDGCVFAEYRIEIWRTHYDPQTLLPDGERLASTVVRVSAHEH